MDTEHPELEPSRLPWCKDQHLKIVKLNIIPLAGNYLFSALTVHQSVRLVFQRWEWRNHYGRDWSRGDGSWVAVQDNGFTREELLEALRLTETGSGT